MTQINAPQVSAGSVAMPDIASSYARFGQQVAQAGKNVSKSVIDLIGYYQTEAGKSKLITEIKKNYPEVAAAYPDEVLKKMEPMELGKRLAGVVDIDKTITEVRAIDPNFSIANEQQMKAEIFKNPDQSRQIKQEWMAIAEKNKQAGIDKKFIEMPTTTGGQPAMPQPEPFSTAQALTPPEMQNLKGQAYIDAMAAEDAKKAASAPQMPAVPGKPMTKEAFYASAATQFEAPPSATAQSFKDKGLRSEKDINLEAYKNASLSQKQQAAREAIAARAKQHADRMALGNRNAKANEMLVGLTAIGKAEDVRAEQIELEMKAQEAEINAVATADQPELSKRYSDMAAAYRQQVDNYAPNVEAAQGTAAGIVKEIGKKYPTLEEQTNIQKTTNEAAAAYDAEKKGTGQPLFKQLTKKQQAIVIKRYNANK